MALIVKRQRDVVMEDAAPTPCLARIVQVSVLPVLKFPKKIPKTNVARAVSGPCAAVRMEPVG